MVSERAAQARRIAGLGPDHGLAWHVGDATLARARTVVGRGGVLRCELVRPGALRATVEGTRPWPYEVSVSFAEAGGRVSAFEGDCDCPVELDCKHAVAALLHHLASGRAVGGHLTAVADPAKANRAPAWETSLTQLLGASLKPPAERDRVHTPLALQVAVTAMPRAAGIGSVGLRIRPLQFNARNRWVSSGVTWQNLRYGYYTAQYLPQQLESLRDIADQELRRRPHQALTSWIQVDGPGGGQLWEALGQAQASGIDLLLEPAHTPVELSAEPAEVALDLTRADDLRLTPVIRIGDRTPDPNTARLIGQPAHGVLFGSTDLPGDSAIGLAPLRRPLTAELAGMVGAGPIAIPAADEPRFLAEFLPTLRRRITVYCGDGSVELPEPQPPRMVLTATREPGHLLRLHWQWLEESGQRHDLDDRRSGPAADREAMRRVVEEVLATGALAAELLHTGPFGSAPVPRFQLDGAATVDFMTRAWPVLTALPGLITELTGADAALQYRPAAADPVLEVDAPDDEPGHDWFGFAVRVTVEGEHVPFESIFRALAGDESMVILPSGTYLDASMLDERWNRLRELIEEARAMDDAPPGELRIGPYTASRWADLEESGLLDERAARWRARVGQLAAPTGDAIPAGEPPAGLHVRLRDYQRAGLDWLRARFDQGLGGILADDMGLGKTVQMLGLIAHARAKDPAGPPLLVVAPTSVVANWVAEAARFTPGLRVVPITQGGARRGGPLAAAVDGADLVVTSYQLLRIGIDEYRELAWSGLVLDEAQFVKNPQSKGFRCVRDLPVPVTFAVTGTPLENNLMELWALLALTVPGLFPQSRPFTEHYRVPIERSGAPERLAQLRRRTAPFMLRRTKEQVAPELPPKLEQVIEVDLSPRHQQLYQRYLQRERQKILGLLKDDRSLVDNRFQILKSLTLLRQLSLDPSLVDQAHADVPSSKLEVVIDRIAEIVGSGHRVLVFSQFTRFLDRTASRLDDVRLAHCRLDGRTRDRAAVVDAFRSGAAPVFLISLKAGGVGLNLTEADYCVLLDPWWNPAAEAQAVDRAHRIGQTRSVIVHRYVARGTIEEKVMALKAGKAKLFDDVMGASAAGPAAPATLTAAEIRELLG